MSLRKRFNELLAHLNAEDNKLAKEFLAKLLRAEKVAEDDANWRARLEAGGVDNWCGWDDCWEDEEDE